MYRALLYTSQKILHQGQQPIVQHYSGQRADPHPGQCLWQLQVNLDSGL
jgi:hypothetical protein